MRRYSFSVAGFFVLVVLAVLVAALLRPRAEVTFGTGSHSFQAEFPTKPHVTTLHHADRGLGGLKSSSIQNAVIWEGGSSMVWIAQLRDSPQELTSELRATAVHFKGAYTVHGAVQEVRFSNQLGTYSYDAPRFSEGIIKVKGATMFYALGAGNSVQEAKSFIQHFRIVKF